MMGSIYVYSPFHWVVWLVCFLIFAVPMVTVLRKAGYSGWWLFVSFVPLFNVIMFWIFAFADWPNLRRPETR